MNCVFRVLATVITLIYVLQCKNPLKLCLNWELSFNASEMMTLPDRIRGLQEADGLHPSGNDPIKMPVSAAVVKQLVALHENRRLFELSYLIAGQRPEVNNVGFHENESDPGPQESSLAAPKYIYCGIKRPFQQEGEDGKICVHILEPTHTFKYVASMVCVAKLVPVPEGLLFAVYSREIGTNRFEILNWEWIEAGPDGRPVDAQDRYDEETYCG